MPRWPWEYDIRGCHVLPRAAPSEVHDTRGWNNTILPWPTQTWHSRLFNRLQCEWGSLFSTYAPVNFSVNGIKCSWTGLDWTGLKVITAHAQSRYTYGSSTCCHRSLTSLLCWLSEPLPSSSPASFSILVL